MRLSCFDNLKENKNNNKNNNCDYLLIFSRTDGGKKIAWREYVSAPRNFSISQTKTCLCQIRRPLLIYYDPQPI